MYFLLVVIGLWLVFNYCSWRIFRTHGIPQHYDGPTLALLSFIAGLAITAVGQCWLHSSLPIKQVDSTFELAAMRSGDSPAGTFVWGSGQIADSLYYHVLVKNIDGSVSPYQIDAQNDVRIVEDAALQHEGRWTTRCRLRDYTVPAAFWLFIFSPDQTCYNFFTVPVGTVIHSFSAN